MSPHETFYHIPSPHITHQYNVKPHSSYKRSKPHLRVGVPGGVYEGELTETCNILNFLPGATITKVATAFSCTRYVPAYASEKGAI